MHRRPFSRTVAAQRPPASAVAQQKAEDIDDGWRDDLPPEEHFGAGRAPIEAPRDLTAEEQNLRSTLQSGSRPPLIREFQSGFDQKAREKAPESSSFRAGQNAPRFRSPRQDHGRNENSRLGAYESAAHRSQRQTLDGRQPLIRRSMPSQTLEHQKQNWDCPSCRYLNFGSRRDCGKCGHARLTLSNTRSRVLSQPKSNVDQNSQSFPNIRRDGLGKENRWQCPNCDLLNFPRNLNCHRCRQPRPDSSSREDEETLRVRNWKHVRRRGSSATEQQEEQQPLQENSADASIPMETDTSLKARAMEEARMARMERTKDGRFVGLHNEDHRLRSSSSRNRTPSLEGSNAPSNSGTKATSSAEENVKDGWVQWQPSISDTSQVKDTSRTSRTTGTLDGWEYPGDLDHTSADNEADTALPSMSEKDQHRDARHQTRNATSSNFEFEEAPRPQQIRNVERFNNRDTRSRARGSGIEVTSTPLDRNRYKERKSKKFVSAIDDLDEEEDTRVERRAERRKQREKAKVAQKAAAPPTPVYLPEFISVSNLAGVLKVRVEDFIRKMTDLGFEETNNDHVLDAETAGLVAAEFNFEPIIERTEDKDLLPLPPAEDKSILPSRPPVVTIMGHVDHGKTTMLDYLRKSAVAASEHGGITQHIGAFSVPMPGGRLVTFLDTPGHEAFLSMRQRGANVTDIVILVVAADDSVKPQTIEAIKHAQTAKVPMIVAVNKIDKEDSNVERVKQDLARYGVEIEDYGGDTQVVCVSGKTGQGMEELEDAAVALADILDMRAEIDGQAEGWVLEATTKKAGRVATILVKRGTLRPGDVIVAGTSWARVRSLRNEAGVMVPSAGPGTPVEIDGWREQPSAGDEVIQAPDEQKAKSVIEYRLEASERTKLAADMEAVNETRRLEQEKREQLEKAAELAEANPDAPAASQPTTAATPTFQEVFFIIKADVSGSVEAVTNSVSALGNSEVRPHILRSGVGPITEFDIDHAAVAKGHVINFNTVVEGQIQRLAESKDVQIIDQSIIYRLVDDVMAKLGERLPEVKTQRVLGEAEVAQVFEINTKGRVTVPVAGCRVRNGVISKTARIRVLRDKETVFDGKSFLFSAGPSCLLLSGLTY